MLRERRDRWIGTDGSAVIARNALAQEESEEYSGEFDDPINIHIDNDREGCAC